MREADAGTVPAAQQLWALAAEIEQDGAFQIRPMVLRVLDACQTSGLPEIFVLADTEGVDAMIAAGAAESAVLALIPGAVQLTGGVFADRTKFVAQAIIVGARGGHSLKAKSLAAGWMAAYLRALAMQLGFNPGKF